MPITERKAKELLGLTSNYTEAELKKAYKREANKHHPDKWAKADDAGQLIAKQKFQEIKEAYDHLCNPYPHTGNHDTGFGNKENWGGFSRDDLQKMWEEKLRGTEQPFGNQYSHQAEYTGARTGTIRPKTINQTIYITLEQANSGTVYVLKADDAVMCQKCSGTGVIPRDNLRPVRCGDCGQTGSISSDVQKSVKIPAGFTDGSSITVDLVLAKFNQPYKITVKHKQHDLFTAKGKHLYCEIDVHLANMVLGGKYPITTLDGTGLITLKPYTKNGIKYRVPNKGLGDGDLYITLNALLPETVDAYQAIIDCINNPDAKVA